MLAPDQQWLSKNQLLDLSVSKDKITGTKLSWEATFPGQL
jgi:hypothetical protein